MSESKAPTSMQRILESFDPETGQPKYSKTSYDKYGHKIITVSTLPLPSDEVQAKVDKVCDDRCDFLKKIDTSIIKVALHNSRIAQYLLKAALDYGYPYDGPETFSCGCVDDFYNDYYKFYNKVYEEL